MNIDMIEVIENEIKLSIFPKKKQVLIANKYYSIEEETIRELIRIIRTWDNEYNASGYLDGNRFLVNVYYDGKVDKMCGVRDKPRNYQEFVNLVRSIYDRR